MTVVCPPGLERVPGFGRQHYQAGSANCSGSCLFLAQYGFAMSTKDLYKNDHLSIVFFFLLDGSVSEKLMVVFIECVFLR